MKMNCLIIDDEPVARKGMEEYVHAIDFLNLIGICENASRATDHLASGQIDLLFLDIHMPGVSGIDFLKGLKDPPMAIFTTAYSEHALEGFSLDVIDYLLKPITFERFKKAAQKAFEFYELRQKASTASSDIGDIFFFVKSDGKYEKVLFDEVCFIEALQNYAIIHTTSRKLITYITLTSLENQLPKRQFLKVHKSYIVSLPRIKAIEGSEIVIGDARIPVSRALKDEVMNIILGNNLFKR
jgi:DNA-binding LytR/AlgR family response regulator